MLRQHADSKRMLSTLMHTKHSWPDRHLISLSWMYPGKSITRSYSSAINWLSLFDVFSSNLLSTSGMSLQHYWFNLFSWLKWDSISVNPTSSNVDFTDVCQYWLTVSEGMLFWFDFDFFDLFWFILICLENLINFLLCQSCWSS